ncbi:MAG: DNA alkylation repair protein [Flavobacteriaceae bacterium]|nr:DNA alkylation repair protein [Flavobacteriaceae bacterium]
MTVKEIFKEFVSLTNEMIKKHNTKSGVGENQFGVKLGDIRKIAKKIKINHKLSLELWDTNNYDAQMLALLIIEPLELIENELDTMVKSVKYNRVADWLNSYVIKLHPDREQLRVKWLNDSNAMAQRAGWNLTSIKVKRDAKNLDISSILDRLENEMGTADPIAQWTMNFTLAEIGINHPKFRERALQIGETLGVYRDFPTSKGCTSPFAPIWINEIVSRQG